MHKTSLILSVGVILSLGVGIANFVKPDTVPTLVMDSANTSDALDVQSLQQQLAIQQQSLQALELSQRMLIQQIGKLSAESETLARQDIDIADQLSASPESQTRPPASYDTTAVTRFDNAVLNPQLTYETEAAIQRVLQEGDIRHSEIESVECRDTNCRVSVNHDENTTSDEFIAELMMTSTFAKQFNVEIGTTADGREQSIIYLQ